MKELLFLIALLAMKEVAWAETSPPAATFQIALVSEKVRSIADVHFDSGIWRSNTPFILHSAEWELRDVTRHRLAGRVPAIIYIDGHAKAIDGPPLFLPKADSSFNSDVLRHMASVEPGDYQLALLIDGQRASNVVAFTIDPNFEPEGEPPLRVGLLEAPPGEKWGSLAYWTVGPTPRDPKFTAMAVAGPSIWVDGKEVRREGVGCWAGSNAVLEPGKASVRSFNLKDDLAAIDPSQPHAIYVKAAGYVSAKVTLNFGDQSLAASWDAATPTLGPAPPVPEPLLVGRVLGANGKPAAGWSVHLERGAPSDILELTDADGHYAFPGVNPGSYSLICFPPYHTPTNLDFENVVLAAGETRRVDMSWVPPYSITGQVTNAQGHGLNHVEVSAEWRDNVTGGDCITSDLTWRDGSYTIKGQFPAIVWVGFCGSALPAYPKSVRPGDKNVNFVLSVKP